MRRICAGSVQDLKCLAGFFKVASKVYSTYKTFTIKDLQLQVCPETSRL